VSDCIIWEKACNKQGYGNVWFKGKCWKAHRLAYYKAYGDIPIGMKVLHSCDNPPCVNVGHLFLGTQLYNMKDMRSKGRSPFQRGFHPQAIITREQANKIRDEYIAGGISMSKLASKYGLRSKGSISDILARRTWA